MLQKGCRLDSCLFDLSCLPRSASPSDLSLQVLYVEGVIAGSRAAVTLGNTTVCKELSVCIWYWHSQPARDQPHQSGTSRVQGFQGPWTEISRIRQTCGTAVSAIGSTLVAFTQERLSERLLYVGMKALDSLLCNALVLFDCIGL